MQLWGFGPCLACLNIGPRLWGLSAYVVRAQDWARYSSSDDQTQLLLRNRAKYKLSVPFFRSTLLKTELLKDTKPRETLFFVTVLHVLVRVWSNVLFILAEQKRCGSKTRILWKTNTISRQPQMTFLNKRLQSKKSREIVPQSIHQTKSKVHWCSALFWCNSTTGASNP